MFNIIIFGERKHNHHHRCFVVGIMGCESIIEHHHGEKGGIAICSYSVSFKNGKTIDINDTIHVST